MWFLTLIEHGRSRDGAHVARGARARIGHGDLGGGGQRSREGWCGGSLGEDLKIAWYHVERNRMEGITAHPFWVGILSYI